jgi:hypothetical protein
MSGLFGGKSREEREAEKMQAQARLEQARHKAVDQYGAMVVTALERLTRWAFPDSRVEENGDGEWQLWHTNADGEKHIDVVVQLEFDEDDSYLNCIHTWQDESNEYECMPPLTIEALDHALRCCICI